MALTQTDTDTDTVVNRLRAAGMLRDRGLIGGEWAGAGDARTFAVADPAPGETLAEVPRMGAAETAAAIDAAAAAQPAWRALPAKSRAQILRRWADLMVEHVEDLAMLMTLEQGKPLA